MVSRLLKTTIGGVTRVSLLPAGPVAPIATLTPTPGSTVIPPWQAEQEPHVRGILQNRITAVEGTDVPGTGTYKPSVAMRTELRSYHNNDVTVTATADATASATTLTMSTSDTAAISIRDFMLNTRTSEMLRVNGTPSGTSVPVNRARPNTAAAAILAGDTFVIPGGDVNDSGSDYATSRVEVFARFANSSNDAPASWPDPVGSTRYYSWRQYVGADFPTHEGVNWWEDLMQFKGAFTGSPPLGLDVYHSTYRLGGVLGGYTGLGAINKGAWDWFVIGVKWSPDATVGWIEVWRNGVQVMARRTQATMFYKGDGVTPDPIYVKQGIYRDSAWTDTQVVYYSPLVIADTPAAVGL